MRGGPTLRRRGGPRRLQLEQARPGGSPDELRRLERGGHLLPVARPQAADGGRVGAGGPRRPGARLPVGRRHGDHRARLRRPGRDLRGGGVPRRSDPPGAPGSRGQRLGMDLLALLPREQPRLRRRPARGARRQLLGAGGRQAPGHDPQRPPGHAARALPGLPLRQGRRRSGPWRLRLFTLLHPPRARHADALRLRDALGPGARLGRPVPGDAQRSGPR
jgi:hypothetical protein